MSSPESRPALNNRTNVYKNNTSSPWSASVKVGSSLKRSASEVGGSGGVKKRVKISEEPEEDSSDGGSDSDSDSDVEMEDIDAVAARGRRGTVFGMMNAAARAVPGTRPPLPGTRSILNSFVSSHKSDVFKCYSTADSYLTPPYACSYSHGAKNGGPPLLAIATEQGTVHITNTQKRQDWDYEPQRTTLQPHQNGIFDIKWNHSDTLLATASGDLTTQISCPTTQRSLYALTAHTSTVKTVSWDPYHHDLLSTGGRDGTVHIWDLRVESKRERAGVPVIAPVLSIVGAHDEESKGRRKKSSAPKTITSLTYLDGQPYHLVSSGSSDGLLRCWDIRMPSSTTNSGKKWRPTSSTTIDPTTFNGSRPRGIINLAQGTGPTAGLLFALAADARIHTYSSSLASLNPLTTDTYSHANMQTNSFYVRVALSPCGRWLASGGAAAGSAFVYDVSNAHRASTYSPRSISTPFAGHTRGVQLRGQSGEVAAVDWAMDEGRMGGMLTTCADDGTVRTWRADPDVALLCGKDPEEAKWDWAFAVGQ